jgi:hypothetical protein
MTLAESLLKDFAYLLGSFFGTDITIDTSNDDRVPGHVSVLILD